MRPFFLLTCLLVVHLLPPALSAQSLPPDTLPPVTEADELCEEVTSHCLPLDSVSRALVLRLDTLCTTDALLRTTQLGLYVYDLTDDRPLYARGECQRLRPASCQKVVTAVTALTKLGTDYQLTTRLSADTRPDSTGRCTLYMVGGFDPLFSTDDLRTLFAPLVESGIDTLRGDIRLDDTMKDTARLGWGWCWDDDNPRLTPLLLNSRTMRDDDIRRALSDLGITHTGTITRGEVPAETCPVSAARHNIDAVLLPMMKDSRNMMAEALFYHIAAARRTHRGGRREAAASVRDLLTTLRIPAGDYQIADGSGLSLYNYTTPRALVALLRHAYADAALQRHLLPTLPVAATDGTLRRRMHGTRAADNVRAKTGTVEGVSTLAGYLTTAHGHILAFAIMNQGVRRTADGHRFQNRICGILCGE